MVELETDENLNIDFSAAETLTNNVSENVVPQDMSDNTDDTDIVEYKEVEEPCVALTIIGENQLTDTQIFLRRGLKYSIKAFFSAIVLTIMNMFI